MKLKNLGVRPQHPVGPTSSSNSLVYIDLQTAELIVNPVILNKQVRYVFNATICLPFMKKQNV